MSPSQDSEFPEPDSMTVDPANLGSVDPLSIEGIFLVALSKSGAERAWRNGGSGRSGEQRA